MQNKKYAIIVDSISTIGSNGNPNMEDVYILPLGLTTPEGESLEDITSGITTEDILKSAESKRYYKTSTTKIGIFFKLLDDLLLKYDKIIYLSLSSELSSQYNNLNKLINLEDDYKDKVKIIDTLSAGYAIEKMVINILDFLKKNGDISDPNISEIINSENDTSEEYIICKNLQGVDQGGRIKKTFIKIIDKLARVPIILFNKKNNLKSLVKDYDKAIIKINEWVSHRCLKENKKITEICLVSSNQISFEKVQEYSEVLSKKYNLDKNRIVYRKIMYPVLVHTLFDTICLYFKYS